MADIRCYKRVTTSATPTLVDDGDIHIIAGIKRENTGDMNIAGAGDTTTEAINIGTGSATTSITVSRTGQTTTVAGSLQVDQNLTVSGTVTTLSTTNLVVSDPLILINNGGSGTDAGLAIERGGTGDDAVLLWEEGATRFELGTADTTAGASVPTAIATGEFVSLGIGTALTLDAATGGSDCTISTTSGDTLTVTATGAKLALEATGTNDIGFSVSGTEVMLVDQSAGALTFPTNNNIGSSGTDSPTTIFAGATSPASLTATEIDFQGNAAIDVGGTLSLTPAGDFDLTPDAETGANAGHNLNIFGGAGGATGTGGNILIRGGAGGATSGDSGNLTLIGGTAAGSGADGDINIGTSQTDVITIGNTTSGNGVLLRADTGSAISFQSDGAGSAVPVQAAADAAGLVLAGGFAATSIIGAINENSAAIAASGSTLQQAYEAGNTIGMTDAEGSFDISVTSGTPAISLDAAGASNFSVASAALTLETTTSGVLTLAAAGLMDVNAAANLDIDVTGTYDMLATSTFAIAGTGSSTIGTTSGDLSLSTTTSGEIDLTSAGAVDINATTTVDIDGTAISIDGTSASNVSTTSAALTISTITAGALDVTSAGILDLDSAGALSINSSGAAINIGDDAVAQAINIGTGAAARTITIGNSTGATNVVIDGGTGGIDIGTNAVAQSIDIGNTTGATAVNIDAGTGGISLDTTDASNFTVSGAAADLTLGARAATITLNEAGETTLDGAFTATSIVGALNELKDSTASGAGRVINAYTAGAGGITANRLVYISAADTVLMADASANATATIIGVSETTVAAAASVNVVSEGVIDIGFDAGLTLADGNEVFLSLTGGGLATNDVTGITASGEVVLSVGFIKDDTAYGGSAGDLAEVHLVRGPKLIL